MRRAFLVTVPFLFSGCITPSAEQKKVENRREITGLTEMSFDYISSVWGSPETKSARKGGSMAVFENVTTEQLDPDTGNANEQFCNVKLILDQEEIVTDWSYESCRYKDSKLQEAKLKEAQAEPANLEEPPDIEERVDPSLDDLEMEPIGD